MNRAATQVFRPFARKYYAHPSLYVHYFLEGNVCYNSPREYLLNTKNCRYHPMLRTLTATRYVTPLKEGGSLPAIVEADDDGLYVLKFRGAGQGQKALIAELVAGEIGRALGLRIPEIVFMELDPVLGRNEPDFEIQTLIKASAGLNLALDYLPGSLAFDPLPKAMVPAAQYP
jgi:hypothetical protein